jgi:hypothetical protein
MRVSFVTLVYCPDCGTWHPNNSDQITWREHQFWCGAHPEPVRCTATTSFPRIDFVAVEEGEQC